MPIDSSKRKSVQKKNRAKKCRLITGNNQVVASNH